MAEVVVSEFMEEAALAPLRTRFTVLFDPALGDDRRRLLIEVADAAAIIVRNRTLVDEEFLTAAPKLRVVGRLGVGLDNIDLDGCARRGIAVHPATGANAAAVAEYVIASIFILFRGAYQAAGRMVHGEWPRGELQGREIAGKRLALIGYGSTARQVAARAKVLGMKVSAYDPYLPPDDPAWAAVDKADQLEELLAGADALSLHVPLSEATRHLINERSLRTLPAGAIVINTARGGIVDDAAVAAAMRAGHIAGFALDVFEAEPLTGRAGAAFAGLDNVVLTPHIAGLTRESNRRVSDLTVRNVMHILTHS